MAENQFLDEVGRARRELEKWQAAYDGDCGPDPCRYIAEIRRAEERLAAAERAIVKRPPAQPPLLPDHLRRPSRLPLNYRRMKPQGD